MKWSKLDARLATALGDDPDGADSYGRLNVFIRCRPGARKRAFDDLQKIVHSRVSKVGRDFVTASVGRDEVAELSEQPWVQSITLSSVLHPHGSDRSSDQFDAQTNMPNLQMRPPTSEIRPL